MWLDKDHCYVDLVKVMTFPLDKHINHIESGETTRYPHLIHYYAWSHIGDLYISMKGNLKQQFGVII